MPFWSALAGVAAAYALLNFAVIPHVQRAWTAARTPKKIAKVGVIAALESLRTAALVATCVFGSLALVVLLLTLVPGNNAAILDFAFQRAVGVYAIVDRVRTQFAQWFVAVPIALLIVVAWRQRRNAIVRDCHDFVETEQDRLNDERAQHPSWDDLPPSPAMEAIDAKIAEDLEGASEYTTETSEGRSIRQRKLRRVANNQEQRRRLDYERRMQWETFHAEEPPRNARERWLRLVVSRGFFGDLKGVSKLLSRTATAGVFLLIIGSATRTNYADTLKLRLTRLDELRVQAVKVDVAKLREQHPFVQPQQISSDDREAVNHLSDQFARALLRNPAWRPFNAARALSHEGRQALVRRAILSEARLPAPDGLPESVYAKARPAASAAIDDVAHDLTANGTRLGKNLATANERSVVGWFGERWSGVKSAALKHAALYQQPVGVDDLQRSLLDQLLSTFVDPHSKYDGPNELIKQVRKSMTDAGHQSVAQAVQDAYTQFLSDLSDGVPIDAAVGRAETRRPPVPAGVADDIAERLRTATAPTEEPGERLASERITRNHATSVTEDDIGALSEPATRASREGYRVSDADFAPIAEYEDYFPSSQASGSSTTLQRAIAQVEASAPRLGNGGARALPGRTSLARVSPSLVRRAHSFSMLRGFSRVGGVLIGRDAQSAAALDYRDLQWASAGNNITLTLLPSSGAPRRLGPFPADIVHQALAYAADGRPVAVTMTDAYPARFLKIHVHPALLDTQLGVEVTELDRFVDTFTSGTLPERATLDRQFHDQVALYDVARALRIRAAIGVRWKVPEALTRQLDVFLSPRQRDGDGPRERANAEIARARVRSDVLDSSSLFVRKPEFFDAAIVAAIHSCLGSAAGELKAFDSCVAADVHVARRQEELARVFSVPAVAIRTWSGVRERAYTVGGPLEFLDPPRGTSIDDRLWPLDFMVQVAFTTPPVKGGDEYADQNPLEFTSIQAKIAEQVSHGIEDNHLEQTYGRIRQFVILQRLFRVALAGQLGGAFPVAKLALLERETRGRVQYAYTQRWNSNLRFLGGEERFGIREDAQRADAQPRLVPCYENRRGSDYTPARSRCR